MNKDNLKFGERLEFYEPDFEVRKEVAEIYLKVFQDEIVKNWDKYKDYIEYETPEETIKHYKFPYDYNRIWNLSRNEHIVSAPKSNSEQVEIGSIFENFTNEELKMLMEPEMIQVVKYFKWYRKNNPNITQVLQHDEEQDAKYGGGYPYYTERLYLSLRNGMYEAALNDDKEHSKKEIEELENARDASWYVRNVLYYPDKRPDLVDFIINHLQYVDIKELNKLLKLIDKGFEIREAHRPQLNIPVYVLDKYGELVIRYNNRQECMEKEGLGKQYLQQLLNGNKRRKKCTYCEMTDEEYEEHRKTFESMNID